MFDVIDKIGYSKILNQNSRSQPKIGRKCLNYAKSGNFQWFVPVNLSVITFRCLLSLLVETLSTEMNYNGHKLEKKIIFKNRNVDI